ncbi:hypothetical protein LIER_43159 [Lithospermum erythrorhizon]|uniref:MULE transposase domain-containing protein n=1 Tax=Lithospermum erythrorhizon TaxID=34254 RepID=A0AAV3PP40_LITER
MSNTNLLRKPPCIRGQLANRDKSYYCEYHREHGHDKDECRANHKDVLTRHGVEFKLRKVTGYVESSSGSENDNVLSESESDSGIRSITDSSDEEEYDYMDAKDYHIGRTDWCVKNINKTHNGCLEKKIRFCNNTFLAKALEGKFRVMLEMSLAATLVFIDDMFHIKVSKNCARNTKEKALKKINGDHLKQFNLAHTYCQDLMKAQPGSRCYVDYTKPDRPTDPCVLRRLYVYLKPLVDGFHDGFVEKESYDSWKWFLEGLNEDLRITNQKDYVFISDKQKGLEKVMRELLPNVSKRNCAQHIYI